MMSDPVADMLTIIRNGYMVNKKSVVVPYSKQKQAIADLLLQKGYLENVEVRDLQVPKKELILALKYNQKKPAIEKIIRVSKPSRRVYVDSKHLPYVLSGYGIAIISTSKGLMSAREARKLSLGGEIVCKIW